MELAATTSNAIDSSSRVSNKLNAIMAEEKERSDAERQRMLDQITALINANADEERRRLSERIAHARGDIDTSRGILSEASSEYNNRMLKWAATGDTYLSELINSKDTLKDKLRGDWDQVQECIGGIQTITQAVHAHNNQLIEEQIEQVDGKMCALDGFVTRAITENESHHEKFTTTFGSLAETTEGSYNSLSAEVDEMKIDVEEFGKDIETQIDEIKSSIGPFGINAQQPLAILRSHVTGSKFVDYTVTGGTPRRRSYNYPNKLPRTEPHEEIIANLRKEKELRGRFGFNAAATKAPAINTTMTAATAGAVEVEFKSGETTPVDGGEGLEQQLLLKEVGGAVLSPTSTHSPADDDAATAASSPLLYDPDPVQAPSTDTRLFTSEPPLVNSSINTHTFPQHQQYQQLYARRNNASGYKPGPGAAAAAGGKPQAKGGLKELNPNVDVGTYRTGITPASVAQPATGTLLDLQPPLKKQTVEKKIRRGGGKGKDAENNVPSGRRRGVN